MSLSIGLYAYWCRIVWQPQSPCKGNAALSALSHAYATLEPGCMTQRFQRRRDEYVRRL